MSGSAGCGDQLQRTFPHRSCSISKCLIEKLDTILPCAYNPHASFLDSSIRQSGRLLTARFQVRVRSRSFRTYRRRCVLWLLSTILQGYPLVASDHIEHPDPSAFMLWRYDIKLDLACEQFVRWLQIGEAAFVEVHGCAGIPMQSMSIETLDLSRRLTEIQLS